MCERVTVVTLSVCLSVCHSLCLSVTLSVCHFFVVALFENRSYFGEKASAISAVTAVLYVGTSQSLNSLARELLARGTLYQNSHLFRVVVGLQRFLSFPENSVLVTPHTHAQAGCYVIGAGVHRYICLWTKKV